MSDLATLTGQTTIEVVKENGQTARVAVRQIPVGMWQQAIESAFDEAKFIELVANQEAGFADSLQPASRTAIAELAEEVNADFFAYLARRARAVNRIAPGAIAKAATSR